VTLRYGTSFTGLLREGNRVVGLSTQGPDGTGTIRAKIVVGADGAFSKVREALKIPPTSISILTVSDCDSRIGRAVSESFYYVGQRTIWESFRRRGTRSISST